MHICCLCHKRIKRGSIFFKTPKGERKRRQWSEICGSELSPSDNICEDHFSSSDIIRGVRKVSLTPNAIPFLQPVKNEEKVSSTNIHVNTGYDKDCQKCRCCTKTSSKLIQLENCVQSSDGKAKTYKDLLYEITNLNISIQQEKILPQQICQKCGTELKNSYKFIQRACKVSQQYLNVANHHHYDRDDIKNIEHLQESLIEITETSIAEQAKEELKVEPLSIECNTEIKNEKVECDIFPPAIQNYDEFRVKKDVLQNSICEEPSSEAEEDSDEPESLKDFDMDVNEPVARCCDICHKIYRNEKFLKIHKRYTHMPEENKMPCPLCSYKASRTSALKVHMGLVHGHDKVSEYFKPIMDTGKKYPCHLCPRSYARKDSLRKHIRRKHINKPSKEDTIKKSKILKPKEKQRFLCTYCGQSFSSKGGLESHALTHTVERPFSCEICSKTFKRLKDLQLHRVIHSDEKPHQCSECGKAFKRVDKLKIHMRVHSELRPYKCNECEKTFKYPSVLRTHMHIHTGQTPFTCKTCGEAFSLRTSLNIHCLKNDHVK